MRAALSPEASIVTCQFPRRASVRACSVVRVDRGAPRVERHVRSSNLEKRIVRVLGRHCFERAESSCQRPGIDRD